MTQLFKDIARYVVLAQIESDAAKDSVWREERNEHYARKADYVSRAIGLLKSNPPCGIAWREYTAPDQNGYKSRITYFDFYIYGTKLQVSFHGFSGLKTPNSGSKAIEWDHKNSRQSCRFLNNRCNLHLIIQKY